MAGSITVTTSDIGGGYTRYSVAWVSDASGVVSGNAFAVKRGRLAQAKFVPDGGGTQPTDLYDVTLTEASGVDVLGGIGGNLSNATAKIGIPLFGNGASAVQPPLLEGGNLTPVVANAGNAKGGTIVLLVGP